MSTFFKIIKIEEFLQGGFVFDNHARIYIRCAKNNDETTEDDGATGDDEGDTMISYERVVKIQIIKNNLVITQISNGEQELWENNPGEGEQLLGNLVGITYSTTVGNYTKFKDIEIYISEDIIPRHKNNKLFSNSVIIDLAMVLC